MKKYKTIIIAAVLTGLFCNCSENDYLVYDSHQKDELLFRADSVHFIYGLLPDNPIDLRIPLDLIGLVDTESDRSFAISVNTSLSTATENVHFHLPSSTVVCRDSAVAWINLDFIKPALTRGETYKLVLELEENAHFRPAQTHTCAVYFGDENIPMPAWWNVAYVGEYNQDKYIRFLDYFHQAESKNAVVYKAITEIYGTDLDRDYTYAYEMLTDFRFTGFFTKYVLSLLYEDYLDSGDDIYQIPQPNI